MEKEELESYLSETGWRGDHRGIYEKEPIPLRRLKLLKTSLRLEVWTTGSKWSKVDTFLYKDLEIDSETGKLWVIGSKSTIMLCGAI